ncbi:MAG: TIGR04255 family protein [Verrucomicrobiales bacterium]|nr:TIGR04255 family protein [Verrucomicrobiales bacterium]
MNRAPITEALIDIHVEPRAGLSFAELREAFSALDFGYYFKNPISQGTFEFKLPSHGEQPHTTADAAQIGLRLHSMDEKYVVQCRLAGFTLSRLAPYEAWPTLAQETKRVWSIYRDRLGPTRVTRAATRFINNLRLPLEPGESFQNYLEKFADVPNEAPQDMASFFQRFQLVDTPGNAFVNLTVALDSTPREGPTPVILDIDAFAFRNLSPESEDLWIILDQLRQLKNRCFFGSLTERAAELYE